MFCAQLLGIELNPCGLTKTGYLGWASPLQEEQDFFLAYFTTSGAGFTGWALLKPSRFIKKEKIQVQ
ncbi:hypothetical protein A7Q10_08810 [Methylacidiphilum caldifontis]|uniref:Uncharacterized protein n=1 Tax=Methylacidiphilum caldifontis TaxID=2795386 RepID=A0A4Y8PDF8_9BACT|nr:hypothetical protein A7Q10_08810 [Methylacidiphilum caldifontis]